MATTNINEVENMLDNLDPSTVKARDAVHFRRIIAAQHGVARADRELHDAVRAFPIEVPRRLVGKHQFGRIHQRAGNSNPLLLTARKLAG